MSRRIEPDRAALEVAYRLLRTSYTLDQVLTSPTLFLILKNVARRHMQRRAQTDIKKLQAADAD